jgi:hypothetical protein
MSPAINSRRLIMGKAPPRAVSEISVRPEWKLVWHIPRTPCRLAA